MVLFSKTAIAFGCDIIIAFLYGDILFHISKIFKFKELIFGSVFDIFILMIVVFKFLVPRGYAGISIYPFIVLKHKAQSLSKTFINHENIHLKQQLELLIVPFYIWYVMEFLWRLLHYKNWNLAYRNISFEREAYANELNLEYLESRKFWGFLTYLRINGV